MAGAPRSVDSVLIVGGTSEIGLAIAHRLVRRGARTFILAGRSPAALQTAADGLRAAGAATVEVEHFDARATGEHAALVDRLFDARRIDVAVIAFGVLGDQAAAERDAALAVDVALVNYVGAVSIGMPLAQRLRRQGHGHLIVMSSVAAERARPANFVYGSSKAGLDAFTEGLSHMLSGSGVGVTTVRPGFVATKMTKGRPPAPFATTPDAVARAVVGAIDSRRAVVWVPGALRWLMFVMRHLPRRIVRRLTS